MLLESINYLEELPASIELQSVLEEPYHYHKELELVLVLRGTTSLKVRHSQYKLSEGDLILIDMRDLPSILQRNRRYSDRCNAFGRGLLFASIPGY